MGAAGGGAMAGLGLYQAYGQAMTLNAMGEYQKSMSKINAKNAEYKAQDALERGDNQVTEYRKKINKLIGSQRVAAAGSGVEVGYGSNQQIVDETREIAARDVATIKNNSFLEAMGYRAEASEALRRGRMNQMASRNEAVNTLITGGLKAAETLNDNYGSSLMSNKIKSSSKPKIEVA
jgi:hypothetical protein